MKIWEWGKNSIQRELVFSPDQLVSSLDRWEVPALCLRSVGLNHSRDWFPAQLPKGLGGFHLTVGAYLVYVCAKLCNLPAWNVRSWLWKGYSGWMIKSQVLNKKTIMVAVFYFGGLVCSVWFLSLKCVNGRNLISNSCASCTLTCKNTFCDLLRVSPPLLLKYLILRYQTAKNLQGHVLFRKMFQCIHKKKIVTHINIWIVLVLNVQEELLT